MTVATAQPDLSSSQEYTTLREHPHLYLIVEHFIPQYSLFQV